MTSLFPSIFMNTVKDTSFDSGNDNITIRLGNLQSNKSKILEDGRIN